MNQSITRLTLDVSVKAKQACVSVRQFDTMRRLVFSLVDRGLPYKFEAGVYAYMSATTSANLPLFGSCVIQDGAVHFDVPPEMTSEIGVNECELILHAADHRVLTTNGFDVVIYETEAGDYAEDAISGNHFYAMLDATTAANNAAKNANDAAELARDAEQDAYEATRRADEISETLENKLAAGEFKGEKGDTGATGPQGPAGPTGPRGEEGERGEEGKQGPQGDKGDDGEKGDPGNSVFVRYSENEDGTDFTTDWNKSQNYIGIAVAQSAPADKARYTWSLFVPDLARKTFSGNGGQLDLQIENNGVYSVTGYDTVNVIAPAIVPYTAHIFVTFPQTASKVGFIFPEGLEISGTDPETAAPGERWEANVDNAGGILLYRKQAIV